MLNASQQKIETHQAWLLDDGAGNFTGAIIPIAAPLAGIDQWQRALDTILSEAIIVDPTANLNGMYVITFHRDENPQHSGLLMTRLRHDVLTGYEARLPESPLGLIAIMTDAEGTRIAIATLSGGVSETGAVRPNRTLCSIADPTGANLKTPLSRSEQLAIRAIGKFMHSRLDRHLEAARG